MQNNELKKKLGELIKYGIVGVAHNAIGYIIFLVVTARGVSPVVTVAVLYPTGALVSFFLNKHWTFQHKGSGLSNQLVRYLISHIIAYVSNLLLLEFFSGTLGFPHQWVQLVLMFVIALFLFLMFKYFVLGPKENIDDLSG